MRDINLLDKYMQKREEESDSSNREDIPIPAAGGHSIMSYTLGVLVSAGDSLLLGHHVYNGLEWFL